MAFFGKHNGNVFLTFAVLTIALTVCAAAYASDSSAEQVTPSAPAAPQQQLISPTNAGSPLDSPKRPLISPAAPPTGKTTIIQQGGTVTAPPGWQMRHVNGEQCPESPPLLIELGKITIAVPRSTGELVDVVNDGMRDQLPHRNEHIPCDLKVIHNAWKFFLPTVQVILPNAWHVPADHARPVLTQYDLSKRQIDEARESHTIHTQTDGIEKIIGKGIGEIFILPLEKAPTADRTPVVLDCNYPPKPKEIPLSFCHAAYMHPSGLMLAYTFPRDKYPTDNFLDADSKERALLERWILSAKSINPIPRGE